MKLKSGIFVFLMLFATWVSAAELSQVSAEQLQSMQEIGMNIVYDLKNGIQSWIESGHPVTPD